MLHLGQNRFPRKIFFICLIFTCLTVNSETKPTEPMSGLVLRSPWQEVTTGENAIYGCEDGVYRAFSTEIAFNTPSPLSFVKSINKFVDFSDLDAKRIAQECRANFSNSFDLVGCASRAVNKHFKDKEFTGLNSFCRSHTHAFNKTFKALNIPRSNSSDFNVTGGFTEKCDYQAHILNRVVLTDEDGQPYVYVIDSGWFPGEAFPLTQMTVDYHQKNSEFPKLKKIKRQVCQKTKEANNFIPSFLNFINSTPSK